MISQPILIAVVIGVFFAGIGVSYAHFANTYDPMSMKFQNQELFDQMMSNNPKMSQMWINSNMMEESQMQQQMMNMMKQNPQQMQQIIMNNMYDSDQMTMMEDMMKDMMSRMQNDPELKQAMMEHMDRMRASRDTMMGTMDTDSSMMNGVMKGSSMAFNPDVPITIPMIDGYYNGEKVYFIHTELSDEKMASMMTSMVNFPTLHVPDLENIPEEDLGKFYVFTNGVAGTGPYGGGPFFFQIDIFDTVPNSDGYSEFRVPQLVTWNDNSVPRILTSVDDLLDAQTNGELSIKSADFVVHLPMIVWDSGTKQQAEQIEKPFITMPKFDAQVINIDEDNYTVTLQFNPIDAENNIIQSQQKDQSKSMMENDMMMDSSMMPGSDMENMPFNVKTQITLPMLNGYYNDKKVHFIHTEVSDSDIAQRMSMMTNFQTLYVSDLTNMSHENMSIVYAFTNGVPGDGPYIGGPFEYQVDVFDSIPGQQGHTQFKMPYLVTWNEDSEPRILTSVEDIMESEEKGELSITKTELVINMPMVTWYDDEKQEIEHIVSPYMTIPGYDAMVVNIDEENGLLSLKFHPSGTQMNMMN